MTPNLAIEKLAAAIQSTEVTWRDGTTYSSIYVQLKKKDAVALLRLLRPEDKEVPDFIQPATAK